MMTTSQPDPSQYETVKHLIQSGQREQARMLLTRMVQEYPTDPHSWYGLSLVVDEPERQKYCLRRALALMPDSQTMREQLDRLEGKPVALSLPVSSAPPASGVPSPRGGTEAYPASVLQPVTVPPPSPVKAGAVSLELPPSPAADTTPEVHVSPWVERRRRSMKIRLLIGLPVLAILCCLAVLGVTSRGIRSSGLLEGLPAVHQVTMRAEGSASDAHIIYFTGSGGARDLRGQALPWSFEDTFLETIPAWVIIESGEPDKITCVITVDGREVVRETSNGNSGQVGCRYEFLQTP